MLGIVIRIAQRIGLYSEPENIAAGPLEGEIRRRLWWSLVAFDARISEMSNHKEGISLAPTWDCAAPSNVNEYDLRPDSKSPPNVSSAPTDAIFAVVRGEMGLHIRRTSFHLDFTNPALKKLTPMDKLSKQMQGASLSDSEESEVDELERMIESKYLRHCDDGNPIHFMTIWYARGYLARCRLIEFYAKCAITPSAMLLSGHSPADHSSPSPTKAQRHEAFRNALRMLECDTKVMMSPLTQGYLWLMDHNFPIVAYFQIIQHLRRHPLCDEAQYAWNTMDESYEARFIHHQSPRDESGNPLVHFFAKVVLGAWAAREMAFATQSSSLDPLPPTPKIVEGLRNRMAGRGPVMGVSAKTETMAAGVALDPFLMGTASQDAPSMPMAFEESPQFSGWMDFDSQITLDAGATQQGSFDPSMYPFDFSSMYAGMSFPPNS
jgi:hypothetical protein